MSENHVAKDNQGHLYRGTWDRAFIDPNPDNPNQMTERQFNKLYENMQEMGFTDPVLCIPHPEKECDLEAGTGWLMLVGGEHRWQVSEVLDYTQIPVTVNADPEFTGDAVKFQIVKHNIIRGRMDPSKFLQLYESLDDGYSEEVASEMFGFTDEAEFAALIKKTEKSLPKEIQGKFKEASKEVKTINDLAKVLNQLFATYGDTLPYNYMIMDCGGRKSVWLRCAPSQYETLVKLGQTCQENQKALDHVVMAAIDRLGDETLLNEILQDLPDVEVKSEAELPTLDFLDEL